MHLCWVKHRPPRTEEEWTENVSSRQNWQGKKTWGASHICRHCWRKKLEFMADLTLPCVFAWILVPDAAFDVYDACIGRAFEINRRSSLWWQATTGIQDIKKDKVVMLHLSSTQTSLIIAVELSMVPVCVASCTNIHGTHPWLHDD